MADSGNMAFWHRGTPLAPRDTSAVNPTTDHAKYPNAGAEAYWSYGAPIWPQQVLPGYNWGNYGSPWGSYANLASDYITPERIARDSFERIVPVSTAIGADDTSAYTWGGNNSSSQMQVDGRRLKFIMAATGNVLRPTLPVAIADGQVRMQFEYERELAQASDTMDVAIIFRKTDSTHWYRLLFNLQVGGANAWALQKTSNGGSTYSNCSNEVDVGTQEIVSPLARAGIDKINMVVDYSDTLLRAKIWRDSDTEPGWKTLCNDSTIAGAGDVGIEVAAGNNTVGVAQYPIAINFFTVSNSVTTATVTGAGVPSSTDAHPLTDAATVIGLAVVSSTDHAAYLDANTVIAAGVPSSTDHAAYLDSNSVSGAGVISASVTGADTDSATVIGAAVISSTDHAAYHDAATAQGAGVPSQSDSEASTDAATVIGQGVISASEHEASRDAATVVAVAVISSTDHAAYHDAASVSGAGVVSESDHAALHDANSVIGLAVISSTDHATYHEPGQTVIAVGIPSSAEVYTPGTGGVVYTDANTVRGIAVISSIEHFHPSPHPAAFTPRLRGYHLSGRMTIKLGVPA